MEPETTGQSTSDEELVRTYKSDPTSDVARAAVEQLLGKYRSRVYVWCYRMVHDSERAQDLAQESLVNAYRGLDRFGDRSSFSSWLFAIVRNRCISALRTPNLIGELDPLSAETEEDDPLDRILKEEEEDRLVELIRQSTTPLEQEAVWLRCFERLPVDEITRVLNVSGDSGARGLLQTARRKLRAALGKERRGE